MSWISNIVDKFGFGLNKYYANTLLQVGNIPIPYDFTKTWAIETAFAKNPDVYAIIAQMANKSASIPFFIKKIQDESSLKNYYSTRQFLTKNSLKYKAKAFNDEYLPLPLAQPNSLYKWKHFIQLFATYLNTTGDCFIYRQKNELEEIVGYYVLPTHYMQIYVKNKTAQLEQESPILGYDLIFKTGENIPFAADEVIHVKLPNPEFGLNGENLYGFSPLKAAYYNVENVIQANEHLYKMFKSSGAFGFIFAKGETLDPNQAEQFTQRIKEMDASKDKMARISGMSTEIGFQRVALSNKDMQPWDSLNFDRKTICNVLGWRDELLNNDGKSSLGGSNENAEARKSVLLDTIMPQMELLEEELNEDFKTFKGYENTKFIFDVTEMPELQDDINQIVEWANKSPITTNEFRELLNYEPLDNDVSDKILIPIGKMTLDELEARGLDIENLGNEPNNA